MCWICGNSVRETSLTMNSLLLGIHWMKNLFSWINLPKWFSLCEIIYVMGTPSKNIRKTFWCALFSWMPTHHLSSIGQMHVSIEKNRQLITSGRHNYRSSSLNKLNVVITQQWKDVNIFVIIGNIKKYAYRV